MTARDFIKTETKELHQKIKANNKAYRSRKIGHNRWMIQMFNYYNEFVQQVNKHIK